MTTGEPVLGTTPPCAGRGHPRRPPAQVQTFAVPELVRPGIKETSGHAVVRPGIKETSGHTVVRPGIKETSGHTVVRPGIKETSGHTVGPNLLTDTQEPPSGRLSGGGPGRSYNTHRPPRHGAEVESFCQASERGPGVSLSMRWPSETGISSSTQRPETWVCSGGRGGARPGPLGLVPGQMAPH
ncbi:unnamed protein product [Gadus morhua 'NCC']